MMPDRHVKVGVAGVGSLGKIHARIYHELPTADFVGVYDTDAGRAREIGDTYSTRVFESLDALGDAVEAASVAVPTHHHREVAGRLLERDCHLLVEKPITDTTGEAEELVALAADRNLILQVGHVERFNPVLAYLEEAATRPRFIEAHRLASYPPPREGLSPRGTEVSVVLDLMIHDIEVILHLVKSKVTSVHAVGVPVLSATADLANARLIFENGCVANITASRISPERMRKIRVFLSDAYISLDYQAQEGLVYRKTATGILPENVPIEKGEPLLIELGSFVGCVAAHDEPVVSGEHASNALRLAVEIQRLICEETG